MRMTITWYLYTFLLFDVVHQTLAQDTFASVITALNKEMKYELENDSTVLNHINDEFFRGLTQCREYHPMVTDLSFEGVVAVKRADLKQAFHKNYYYRSFSLNQITFDAPSAAGKFIHVLDLASSWEPESPDQLRPRSNVQECINKGGITWWQIEETVYIIMSQAYSMTFEYEKLWKVINKAHRSG